MISGIVLSSISPSISYSQTSPEQCLFGDAECYRLQYERACDSRAEGALLRCAAWIRSTEARATQGDRAAQRLSAAAHVEIAMSLSTDAAERARNRSAALSIYRSLVAGDSTDVDAIVGIASLTEESRERLNLLRRAVNLRPDSLAVLSLTRELRQSGRSEDLLEAAEALRRAYSLAPPGPGKWNLAGSVSRLYEDAGSRELGDAFVERLRQDLGAEGLLRELMQVSPTNPARTTQILDALCYPAVVELAGADFCMRALGGAAQNLPQASSRAGTQLIADRAADLMGDLSQESELALIEADPAWRDRFSGWLDAFNGEGFESVKTYWARALIELNSSRKIQILEQSLLIAPANVALLTSLGAEYMRQQQWDRAIEKYREARNLTTTQSIAERSMIDHNIRTAEELRDAERTAPNRN